MYDSSTQGVAPRLERPCWPVGCSWLRGPVRGGSIELSAQLGSWPKLGLVVAFQAGLAGLPTVLKWGRLAVPNSTQRALIGPRRRSNGPACTPRFRKWGPPASEPAILLSSGPTSAWKRTQFESRDPARSAFLTAEALAANGPKHSQSRARNFEEAVGVLGFAAHSSTVMNRDLDCAQALPVGLANHLR